MILPDVNILVYAFRRDSERHEEYREWLLRAVNGRAAFGLSEQVLAGLLRITTHPRVFINPSTRAEAASFSDALRSHPLCRLIRPSEQHWPLFLSVCEESEARGNLIPDAWYAALAIESGCTWITADRDYARFPGLTWQHPLDHAAAITNPAP